MIFMLLTLNGLIAILLSFFLFKYFLKQALSDAQQKRIEEKLLVLQQLQKTQEHTMQETLLARFNLLMTQQIEKHNTLQNSLERCFNEHRAQFDEKQLMTFKLLQETLQQGELHNRQAIKEALFDNAKELGSRFDKLTLVTENKLKEINEQVEKRLSEGFQKTTETFGDVIKRLALIDAAQKKITELSSNIVSLQDLLNDKRSRGTFGEVQLAALIRNMIPEQHFSFQHLLSNQKRPDCMLFLPEPTGNLAIDAKFPLENYRLLIDQQLSMDEREKATKQFKLDIKKHILTIAEKYIIQGETADGAVMFIPAEAIFSEIHAHHADLVDFAHLNKVWLVSPTTLMAILTTARAVLKDAATRKEVHEIQKHLRFLSEDFQRFRERMDQLAKRIAQAQTDVEQVHISSRKISERFLKIEKTDFEWTHQDEIGVLEEQV